MKPLNNKPFPYRIEEFGKTFANVENVRKKFNLDQQIQRVKDQLRVLIQANYPVIPANPFVEPVANQYMRQYFGPTPMGQNWQRNIAIQNLLINLNNLEKERKELD